MDEWVFGSAPEPDARAVEVAPLDTRAPYPPVSSVPQRPQLSYTVQQEREIVDALISDREHARYTGSVVRYRSGVSGEPSPAPTAGSRLRGEDVVEARDGPAGPEPLAVGLEDSAPYAGARALPPERAELDDGGLDDFVRGLVGETEAEPDLATETAVIDRRDRRAAIPGGKGEQSAFQRLFLWIGQELGGEGEGSGAEPGAATPSDPAPDPVDPEAGASSEDTLPKLKPDESADPPVPAPEKPDGPDDEPDQSGAGAVPLPGSG